MNPGECVARTPPRWMIGLRKGRGLLGVCGRSLPHDLADCRVLHRDLKALASSLCFPPAFPAASDLCRSNRRCSRPTSFAEPAGACSNDSARSTLDSPRAGEINSFRRLGAPQAAPAVQALVARTVADRDRAALIARRGIAPALGQGHVVGVLGHHEPAAASLGA